METASNNERLHHPPEILGSLYSTQGLVRDWISHPEWKSYDVLPCLYVSLHSGKKTTPAGRNAPKLAQAIRDQDRYLIGNHANLFVEGDRSLYLITTKFSDKLDELLEQHPKTLESCIHDAAFVYYVFERIHPFPDGNGRVGRLLIKRLLKGAGLKDPLFHDASFFQDSYTDHDRALSITTESNSLDALEAWLASMVIKKYDPVKERETFMRLEEFISARQARITDKNNGRLLSDIWEGFEGIRVYNNKPNPSLQ